MADAARNGAAATARRSAAKKETAGVLQIVREHPTAHRVIAVILFFIFWEYAARDANPLFISYPTKIGEAAWEIINDGTLLKAFLASLLPFVIGMAISIFGGVLLGVLLGKFWFFERTIDPFVNALYVVPRIALVPLIMLWAGLKLGGKVTIITSIAIFPIIINTYSGIRDVRGSIRDIGRAFGASEWQAFWKIQLPASVPFIMTGIRIGVGFGIIGMVVAEFFTAISGLGGLIIEYSNAFATAHLFVPIVAVAFMGIGLTELVQWIERRVSKWRTLEQERAGQN
jgi:NitT/TauT family transport system permease protein